MWSDGPILTRRALQTPQTAGRSRQRLLSAVGAPLLRSHQCGGGRRRYTSGGGGGAARVVPSERRRDADSGHVIVIRRQCRCSRARTCAGRRTWSGATLPCSGGLPHAAAAPRPVLPVLSGLHSGRRFIRVSLRAGLPTRSHQIMLMAATQPPRAVSPPSHLSTVPPFRPTSDVAVQRVEGPRDTPSPLTGTAQTAQVETGDADSRTNPDSNPEHVSGGG